MTLLLTLLIMAVIGLVAAVAAGRISGGLDEPASSLPGRGLPPGPFTLDDVDRVRFSPALRGYRMDEVDDVVDRLADELRRRDEELAALRRSLPVEHVPSPDGDFRRPAPGAPSHDPFAHPAPDGDIGPDDDTWHDDTWHGDSAAGDTPDGDTGARRAEPGER